jgi:hypothetical protein
MQQDGGEDQPPPEALVGVSFSPSTVVPTTTTVTSSQLAMIA